ncbi:hypothetical protein CYMTET_9120 [Cymbomonas tetramitiformis]|uniref:Uncharacterized protein n=1 Tax=Cymbomonas tetramitiformis TaxID=36881 RepID=A0AAE0LFF2_9CHLO|nr:hypothetical protein CYMTET_9120 [Cymbomonas tetramitiformis]
MNETLQAGRAQLVDAENAQKAQLVSKAERAEMEKEFAQAATEGLRLQLTVCQNQQKQYQTLLAMFDRSYSLTDQDRARVAMVSSMGARAGVIPAPGHLGAAGPVTLGAAPSQLETAPTARAQERPTSSSCFVPRSPSYSPSSPTEPYSPDGDTVMTTFQANLTQMAQQSLRSTGAHPEDQPTFAPSAQAPLAGSLADAVLEAPLDTLGDPPLDDYLTSWRERQMEQQRERRVYTPTPSPPSSDQDEDVSRSAQRRRLSRERHATSSPDARRGRAHRRSESRSRREHQSYFAQPPYMACQLAGGRAATLVVSAMVAAFCPWPRRDALVPGWVLLELCKWLMQELVTYMHDMVNGGFVRAMARVTWARAAHWDAQHHVTWMGVVFVVLLQHQETLAWRHRVAQAVYVALVLGWVVFVAAGGKLRWMHGGWRMVLCMLAANPPARPVNASRILKLFVLLFGALLMTMMAARAARVGCHGDLMVPFPPPDAVGSSWEAQQSSRQWGPGWVCAVSEQEVLPYTVLDELQPGGKTTVTKDEAAWLDTELNATFGGHPDFTDQS